MDERTDFTLAQVARILSLDVDGSGFALLAERDPVVGRPYRTWVSLLLRTELEDETHEIAGRRP
jgi:hypothetical protein